MDGGATGKRQRGASKHLSSPDLSELLFCDREVSILGGVLQVANERAGRGPVRRVKGVEERESEKTIGRRGERGRQKAHGEEASHASTQGAMGW